MNGAEPQRKTGAEDTLPLNTDGEAIAMCFSGGKDSSLALWEIRRAQTYVVRTLLTTVNAEYDRVSMHGVRRELLREQADAIGIPMTEVPVPLSDLPPGVDPCGENGEFHTFVYDGLIFRRSARVFPGEVVQRDPFAFCDLLSASPSRRCAPLSPQPRRR